MSPVFASVATSERLISWSSLATRSLALVAVLVAVEAVEVAAWVLALVVELTCAWRPQGYCAERPTLNRAEIALGEKTNSALTKPTWVGSDSDR